jgi:hypothetical protein
MRRPSKPVIEAIVLSDVPDKAILLEANLPPRRRRSKNCGGGISPAAIGALIEGAPSSVNAFRAPQEPRGPVGKADKVLMRLNFPSRPGNA